MSVKCISTGTLSYLESRFLESLRNQTSAAVVLCGSHLLATYLRRRAAEAGRGLFDVRFHTFDSLAADLLPLDYQGRKLISPLGEILTLSRITRKQAGYFKPVCQKPGFVAALFTSLRDLIDAGVPSIPETTRSSPKLQDTALIYEAFTREIEPYISRARALRIATEHLRRFEGVFQTRILRVYGFYDFTHLQEAFLAEAAASLELEAFVPFRGGEASQFARNAADFFSRLAPEVRDDEPASDGPIPGNVRRLLTAAGMSDTPDSGLPGSVAQPAGPALESHGLSGPSAVDLPATGRRRSQRLASAASQPSLFEERGDAGVAPSATGSDADGTLRLFSAPDEAAELLQICREIQGAARRGIDLADMALLLRNPEAYVPLIHEIFPAAGIPYYLKSGVPLAQTHAARSLLLLLELLQSELPRSQVMEFAAFSNLQWRRLLENAGLDFKRFSVSTGAWNRLSAETGISRGIDNWRRRISALSAELGRQMEKQSSGEATADSIAGYRQFQAFQLQSMLEFVEVLDRWKQRFARCRNWRAFSELSAKAIDLFFSQNETRESEPAPSGVPATEAAWRQVCGVLESMSTLDQVDPRATFADRVDALRVALDNEALSVGRFQDGCVSILSVMAARGLRHALVFIPGMTEKGFPLPARQDPILLDGERRQIASASGGNLKEKLDRAGEERLLFDLCLQSARRHVVASFPRIDLASGRPRLPSHYLLTVIQSLSGSPAEYASLEGPPCVQKVPLDRLGPQDPADALTESEFALSAVGRHKVPGSLYASRLRRSIEGYKARWSRAFTQWDGRISAPDLQDFLRAWPGEHFLAPSRLESLASCPYKFFLGNMLRLRAIEAPEATAQISALDRGSLVHEILEGFMRRAAELGWLTWDGVEIRLLHELMEKTAVEAFQRAEERGVTGYPLIWQMDAEGILADLHRFVQDEFSSGQPYLPDKFEVNFGDEAVPPLVLTLRSGEIVRVRGRIDRLDVNRDRTGIRVVDYKTGRSYAGGGPALFEAGRKLQLPLYLLAGEKIYGLPSLQQSVAEYYYVTTAGGFDVQRVSGKRCEDEREALHAVIEILIGAIREGRFPAVPGPENRRNCNICDFRLICDRNIDRVSSFKAQGEDLEFLRRLEDYP